MCQGDSRDRWGLWQRGEMQTTSQEITVIQLPTLFPFRSVDRLPGLLIYQEKLQVRHLCKLSGVFVLVLALKKKKE